MPRPAIELCYAALRANAAACAARAGVPLRAVLKSDGYGWGAEALAVQLDDLVAGYCVADADEAEALRRRTARPIATFADPPPERVGALLRAGIIPNVSLGATLEAAVASAGGGGTKRIRVGIRPAAGWYGIDAADAEAVARRIGGAALEVELWTHLTDPALAAGQRAALRAAAGAFERAGVEIAGIDVRSTASLGEGPMPRENHVRIGIGLFGATLTSAGSPLRCALAVRAPVAERYAAARVAAVGYGAVPAPDGGYVIVARCGYGDGFPKQLAGRSDILSVGMQYTVVAAQEPPTADILSLIDEHTDLDRLCAGAGIGPHQLVVGLGLGRRAAAATMNRPSP
jgi:alanine racemase